MDIITSTIEHMKHIHIATNALDLTKTKSMESLPIDNGLSVAFSCEISVLRPL